MNPPSELAYQSGFGNTLSSEAVKGALPIGRNSPQRPPHGLYAEGISGTAFTAPRAENRSTWMYRKRPSAMHARYEPLNAALWRSGPFDEVRPTPNRLRWDPFSMPSQPTDFVHGVATLAGSGSPETQAGIAVHVYAANRSMDRVFYDADGELMFVPQEGRLRIFSELGILEVGPGEIAVVPRGFKFRIDIENPVRGYLCENYGPAFRLPELGPIGSQGLAQARDFLAPVAACDERAGRIEQVAKFQGGLWTTQLEHSPLDVVAWHGSYVPYKYDLSRFMVIN